MKNLLVELFVEELPPKALKKLGDAFAGVLFEKLKAQGLTVPESVLTAFASPRRLAAHITNVVTKAASRDEISKVMPVSVGLDLSQHPSEALVKKMASFGVQPTALQQIVSALRNTPVQKLQDAIDALPEQQLLRALDGKVEALYFRHRIEGIDLTEGLQKALLEAIAKLPIPKVMTYQLADGWSDVKFVRPAHGLVALHGSDVVAVQALGLKAGNITHGHRFEASVDPVVLMSADSYAEALRKDGAVIASFAERKAEIARQLAAAASKVGGGVTAIADDTLLDEVTGLVERPNVLICEFEKEFLDVPQECLILTMKANQKYFPLLDAAGKLTNKFLVVSNITPMDASAVMGGNERVVRPRLADAKFFYDQDRKKTLASRVAGLDKVVYHNKLGSQGERVARVRAIASWVAEKIGADPTLAGRAAMLAKADLLTDMVGEFPELQGIMGGYYARHDGEHEYVAQAIADQYVLKRDETADGSNVVSAALVLADRVETLLGIWGIGLKPTGEKDPFALRRHALTVISTFDQIKGVAFFTGSSLKLDLADLLNTAAGQFAPGQLDAGTTLEVKNFIYDRYWNQLAPLFGPAAVEAVIVQHPPLHEVVKRVRAVIEFQKLPEAAALAAANKRVTNILKKADSTFAVSINEALLVEPAEKELASALKTVAARADVAWAAGDYTGNLQALAALKEPVDAFFESVMVNAEDPALRANRLGLLATLHQAMNRVADLSKLAT